jgi:hypothetical protein
MPLSSGSTIARFDFLGRASTLPLSFYKRLPVYKTRILMDYIHRPVSSIDHDVSETDSVSETS